MIYLRLFWEFFKIGLFAIGGGPATLPFISQLGERTGWFTMQEMADMLAVAESTPGPMGINMATYVGYKMGGVFGGAFTTLGEVTPSIIVIIIVAAMLQKFKNSKQVENAFYGVRAASAGLVASAVFSIFRMSLLTTQTFTKTSIGAFFAEVVGAINWKTAVLAAVLFYAVRKWNKHPIWYILAAALAGIFILPLF